MRILTLRFDEKDFRKLQEEKEDYFKTSKERQSWERFVLGKVLK
jgi:hypothetical protein